MQKNQSEHSAFNSEVTRKIITDQQTSPLRRVDAFSLNTNDENRSNEETRFESSPFPSPPQQSTDDNHHFVEDKNFQSSSFPSPPQQSSNEHHHSSENGMFKSRSFPSPPQEFSRVPTTKQENLKHLTNYPKKQNIDSSDNMMLGNEECAYNVSTSNLNQVQDKQHSLPDRSHNVQSLISSLDEIGSSGEGRIIREDICEDELLSNPEKYVDEIHHVAVKSLKVSIVHSIKAVRYFSLFHISSNL